MMYDANQDLQAKVEKLRGELEQALRDDHHCFAVEYHDWWEIEKAKGPRSLLIDTRRRAAICSQSCLTFDGVLSVELREIASIYLPPFPNCST